MKRLNKIKLYVLINTDNKNIFLTITNKLSQALEYAENLIKLNHGIHFINWCEAHNFAVDDVKAWNTYFNDCITDDEKLKYKALKISYSKNDIASIMRMFIGCVPLGCSFDTSLEYKYISDKILDNSISEDIIDIFDLAIRLNPKISDIAKNINNKENE